jgi:signal transduction histidine kinase
MVNSPSPGNALGVEFMNPDLVPEEPETSSATAKAKDLHRVASRVRRAFDRAFDGADGGRAVVVAARLLLMLIAIPLSWDVLIEPTSWHEATQTILLAYCAVALGFLVAHIFLWLVDFQLRKLAAPMDLIMCGAMLVLAVGAPALYLPFVWFALAAAPSRKGLLIRLLLLDLVILLAEPAAIYAEWSPVAPREIWLQFGLVNFTAILLLGWRATVMRDDEATAEQELWSEAGDDPRLLSLDFLAAELTRHVGAPQVLFVWRTSDAGRLHAALAEKDRLSRVEIDGNALIPAAWDEQAFLFDPGGKAALLRDWRGKVRRSSGPIPALPSSLALAGQPFCGVPIQAGEMQGHAILLGVGRPTGTLLETAARAGEAMNTALARHQVLARWFEHAQTSARMAMSRDLHDGITQTLAGLRLNLSALRNRLDGDRAAIDADLGEIVAIIAAEQTNLRALMVDRPHVKNDRVDLITLIARRLELLGRQWQIDCRLDPKGETSLPVSASLSMELELLIREAISNAVRYAGARQFTVRLATDGEQLFVSIKSDGQPPAPSRQVDEDGAERIASRSLERRIVMLAGTAYEEAISAGTLLAIRLPVEEHETPANPDPA